ncbi:MAG TPA: D-alanine--D-alanine ligase [Candidatus Paceibacterota bacterium]|nr:D-alanine--D-alanine ligase [Candidatus Paceibacterota bacterium]
MNHLIRVGVLRGGPSSEYDVSLQTGGNVLKSLRERLSDRYHAYDILIDKQGNWHIDGMPITHRELGARLDVIFNALHGSYGEDGTVQHVLEVHGIPFTGSKSLPSAVGMNKMLARKAFEDHGLKIAIGKEVLSHDIFANTADVARELFSTFPIPAVIKPVSAGSSVGVSIVRTQDELVQALIEAAKHGSSVLVEEYISGTEATVGVIEGFRNQEMYALPVIEIRPHTRFFDYQAKYEGMAEEIVPARFPHKIKEELSRLAEKAHRALGLRHYSRSDFIIHPRRGIYILETNTLPGLTSESLVPKALRAVGSDTHELVDHLIRQALENSLR